MKKVFRKIHLWLSVPFGVFITLICFSGAMLVFEKEITEMCLPELYFVEEVKEKTLPLEELMDKVSATLPDTVSATGITISPDTKRTWQVSLSKPRRASVYVDPYTGEVKGRSERLPFYDVMFHLHRWMMGASGHGDGVSLGKLLVGVSTLMLVIILITGILMWLTNKHKPLKKSLVICVTKGWPRFWHDLHVGGGIYATIFLLAFALTGLTWSFSWYRSGFYGMFGVEAGANAYGGHGGSGSENRGKGYHASGESAENKYGRRGNVADMEQNDSTDGERTASVEAADYPHERGEYGNRGHRGEGRRGRHSHRQEGDTVGYAGRHVDASSTDDDFNTAFRHRRSQDAEYGEGARRGWGRRHAEHDTASSPFLHWQEVYENLAQAYPGYRQITLSDGSASVVPEGRNSLRSGDRFDFDAQSGEITGSKPYAEEDKSAKVRSMVYTLHVGSWGGMFTRVLAFLAALLGATLPLTGYYLWIRKMKNKSAHKRPKSVA